MKRYFSFDSNLNLIKEKEIFEKKISKNKSKINYFALAKLSSFGYYLIAPLFFSFFLGLFFDYLLKTKKIFFTIGFLIGIIGIFYNFKKIYTDFKK